MPTLDLGGLELERLRMLTQGDESKPLTREALWSEYVVKCRTLGLKHKSFGATGAWLRGENDVPYMHFVVLAAVLNRHLPPELRLGVVAGQVDFVSSEKISDSLDDLDQLLRAAESDGRGEGRELELMAIGA